MTGAIAGIGTASIAAFNELDAGYDTIITKTGASGEALDGLQDSMDAVFSVTSNRSGNSRELRSER